MSRTQQRRRAVLGSLCALCSVAFAVLAGAFFRQPFHDIGPLMAAWWGSGFAALAFGVAACRVEEDATDNGRYLGSIVRGLRNEWRRS